MSQYAIQDENQFPALLGHSGTTGTAEIRRIVVTDEGAVKVDLVSGDTINIGTINVGTVSVSGTVPVSGTVSTSPSLYALKTDDSSSGTTYVGEATTGSLGTSTVWRIKKIVDTGGTALDLTWAGGSATFTNMWNNRGTLSYS